MMGVGGFEIFRKIIFFNIKWGFVYGVIFCVVRVMGEFGVVLVVLGYIRGKINIFLLYIEILYNEY